MKALWNGVLIAESEETLVVEGNHYFPRDSVNTDLLERSMTQSHCPWKGDANYFNVVVEDATLADAAWTYEAPKEAAAELKDRVAFWRGVEVID